MSLLGGMLPSDVRQVIDRTDEKMDRMIATLSIVGDLLAENNSLLAEQNRLLKQRR